MSIIKLNDIDINVIVTQKQRLIVTERLIVTDGLVEEDRRFGDE